MRKDWVVDNEGGWFHDKRGGVDKEIPNTEGQNADMVNSYSTLEDPAPTEVTTRILNYCTSYMFYICISGMVKMS
jgi:hypothetical protein